MSQKKEIISRFKKWMGLNKHSITNPMQGAADEVGDTNKAVERPVLSKKTNRKKEHAQLQQLADEQSELIDELSDKLLDAEIKLQGSTLQSQHLAAQNIVKTHMASGGAMALLPVPIFDVASLAATQLSLVKGLTKHYSVDFDDATAKAVLISLFSGVIPLLTVVGLSSAVKVIPGVGSVGGGISMTVMSGSVIYAVGQVFIKHFEQGGTLKDFEGKQWIDPFKKSFEKQKALGA